MLNDGRVLVAGGYEGSTVVTKVQRYDPASDHWSSMASMHVARRSHSATLLPDGTVLAVGGFDGATGLSGVELYNPASDLWTVRAPMRILAWSRSPGTRGIATSSAPRRCATLP